MTKAQEKKQEISKHIIFHTDDESEMRIYRILQRKSYFGSKLMIKLLEDFFKEFQIDENTPYDLMDFTIKAYINENNGVDMQKFHVMNQLYQKQLAGIPASYDPITIANGSNSSVMNHSPSTTSIPDDDNDESEYIKLANSFNDMME